MLPSDHDVAVLVAGIYAYPGAAPIAWDHYNPGTAAPGVCWGLKFESGCDIIVFRGSENLEDWMRDFNALANPCTDDELGPVHPGFLEGMRETWAAVKPLISGKPVIVAGHSLGAGRASIFTGLMILDGVAPARRVVFGEPRPGFQKLATILSKVPGASYRNGNATNHDLVTDVPWSFPPLEAYVHPTPLVLVDVEPTESIFESWILFAWHWMPLYVKALAGPALKLAAPTQSISFSAQFDSEPPPGFEKGKSYRITVSPAISDASI